MFGMLKRFLLRFASFAAIISGMAALVLCALAVLATEADIRLLDGAHLNIVYTSLTGGYSAAAPVKPEAPAAAADKAAYGAEGEDDNSRGLRYDYDYHYDYDFDEPAGEFLEAFREVRDEFKDARSEWRDAEGELREAYARARRELSGLRSELRSAAKAAVDSFKAW
ncbi:hypothetical protein FACS1894191_6070 [Clostridia bacterium]|nr:hypothetical protein FACS1894191_6070 [Clostridia bacterium]